MNLAYLQFLPKFCQVQENYDRVQSILEKHKQVLLQTELFVLPEYFLSGPISPANFAKYKSELSAFDVEKKLQELSAAHPNVTFVFGTVLRKKGDSWYNNALVIKSGKLLGDYSKKALIYNERILCKSDPDICVFKVGQSKVGIAICWDLILPEVFRKYASKVDLMIIPSFWGIGGNELQGQYSFSLEKKYYKELGVARAYENSFALAFINAVGSYQSPFYNDRIMGGSFIVTPPHGITHFSNSKDPEQIISADIDFNELSKYQKFYCTDTDYLEYLDSGVI